MCTTGVYSLVKRSCGSHTDSHPHAVTHVRQPDCGASVTGNFVMLCSFIFILSVSTEFERDCWYETVTTVTSSLAFMLLLPGVYSGLLTLFPVCFWCRVHDESDYINQKGYRVYRKCELGQSPILTVQILCKYAKFSVSRVYVISPQTPMTHFKEVWQSKKCILLMWCDHFPPK